MHSVINFFTSHYKLMLAGAACLLWLANQTPAASARNLPNFESRGALNLTGAAAHHGEHHFGPGPRPLPPPRPRPHYRPRPLPPPPPQAYYRGTYIPPLPSRWRSIRPGWRIVDVAPGVYQYYTPSGRLHGVCRYVNRRYVFIDNYGRNYDRIIYIR